MYWKVPYLTTEDLEILHKSIFTSYHVILSFFEFIICTGHPTKHRDGLLIDKINMANKGRSMVMMLEAIGSENMKSSPKRKEKHRLWRHHNQPRWRERRRSSAIFFPLFPLFMTTGGAFHIWIVGLDQKMWDRPVAFSILRTHSRVVFCKVYFQSGSSLTGNQIMWIVSQQIEKVDEFEDSLTVDWHIISNYRVKFWSEVIQKHCRWLSSTISNILSKVQTTFVFNDCALINYIF